MKRIVGGARGYCVGMRMERSQLPPGVLLVYLDWYFWGFVFMYVLAGIVLERAVNLRGVVGERLVYLRMLCLLRLSSLPANALHRHPEDRVREERRWGRIGMFGVRS